MSQWAVDLFINGPITTSERIRLCEPKGFRLEDPFYSSIELRGAVFGVVAYITALASTSQLAKKAALFFFGQMLDTLAIQVNLPMQVSLFERLPNRSEVHPVRRVLQQEEWHVAFREARLLALAEPTFLRALGWYRKGLYTEDPFDKFLAFWNSVEIVTSKYHPETNEAKKGSKSQIWECFKVLWGECEQWPIIKGDNKWIDRNYDVRKNIAHGIATIDVEQVEIVIERLSSIEQVANAFLTGWRANHLKPQIPPEMEGRFGYRKALSNARINQRRA